MPALKINAKFKDLCPPLSDEEYAQLEDNIIRDKMIRDPIQTWKDQIVDGHNRHAIAKKHGYQFKIVAHVFKDENEACNWIILNQLGRRNLSPEDASRLRGKLYNGMKRKDAGHGDQKGSGGQNDPPIKGKKPGKSGKSGPSTSAEVVAQKTGVSTATVKRDARYVDHLESLAPSLQKDLKERNFTATKKEVAELSEYEKPTQIAIVRKVRQGECKTVTAAIKKLFPPEPEEPQQEWWEEFAESHRRWKSALDKVSREVKKMCDTEEGAYLAHCSTRIVKGIKDAADCVRQNEPVGLVKGGKIETRMQAESRKKK